ncbi:MAG: hypothetical protein KAT91_01120, partial [Candidatus Aenigmarchaeota archaeon]|nr:hypothetical protein [Candidatus Aenigmarchaeota archaeon]
MIVHYALIAAGLGTLFWFIFKMLGMESIYGFLVGAIIAFIVGSYFVVKHRVAIAKHIHGKLIEIKDYITKHKVETIIASALIMGTMLMLFLMGFIKTIQYELPFLLVFILSYFIILAYKTKQYSDAAVLYVILVIVLILAPIFYNWTPIIGQKAQNVNTQLGMGEKTEGTFSAISDGIANIWLMLTDPTKWAEQRDVDKGKQEGGDLALEITSVKAMPQTVMPEDEYTMMFELKNLGKNDATTVYVGARVDARALKYGSYIINNNIDKEENNKVAWLYLPIDDVHPQEQRFESFDIVAPKCSGTFTTRAYVEYTYNAIATTNLEVINRGYYTELLQHDKLKFKDQISTSSAGPFKLTIRTQYPQPIPVTKTGGEVNPFKIYFTAINERKGEAYINNITVELPKELSITNEDDIKVCELLPDNSEENTYYINPALKKNMCINSNDMTTFKCEFVYDGEPFEKEKTLFLKTRINYTFTYDKTTTTSVKSNVAGYKACSDEEENLVWGSKDKLSDDAVETLAGVLGKKQNAVLENTDNCEQISWGDLDDSYEIKDHEMYCVTTRDKAETVVREMAKA